MFDLLKARLTHGYQAIPDPLKVAIHPSFPGLAVILGANEEDFDQAEQLCPTKAIGKFSLDMGKCCFCGECSRRFPDTFVFKPDYRMASSSREGLIIKWDKESQTCTKPVVEANAKLRKHFRRSFALRNVSAAGCNACELELGACSNVNFDMGRYGIEVLASPRHADALILTGPVSANMAFALQQTWEAIPEPKALILCGSCAISGGVFAGSEALNREWLNTMQPALFIPGCPAHPLSILHGIMSLLGRQK
ncbi:MAG: NADH:ubiquinone oxidoreductase [Candidatus Cloacimonetes bacterium HGW-Cloacimonetes-3]|nr:MAG: NADH:ubiquinone oxidoreductase [Candidatus Cloacimonetes bacterium HGW-Cloacimonetes-3]